MVKERYPANGAATEDRSGGTSLEGPSYPEVDENIRTFSPDLDRELEQLTGHGSRDEFDRPVPRRPVGADDVEAHDEVELAARALAEATATDADPHAEQEQADDEVLQIKPLV